MKYIYSFLVLVLLFSSCSKTEFLTKTPDKKANPVISEVEAKNAVANYTWEYGRNQTTPENPRDYYWDAYSKLQAMLNGQQKASFKNAVFITENAWYDNRLSYNNYNNYIQTLASVCKAWKKANPLLKYYDDDSIRIALSGAVYKAMTDTIKDEKGEIISIPYSYNFNDAFADKYWADRLVTNLMETHKGNCHSLPFLYKIVAEELNVPAYLSFMPEHIYIKQYSKQYNWYNTELTSKSFPVDAWLMASGYVSTASIVSGIYMDTLSLKQSIAVCVNDLAKGYAREFGNKDGTSGVGDLQFVLTCCDLGLTYYPNYAELLLLKAETLKKLGKDHFNEMEKTYSELAALDYREIPDAMYYRWMSSLVKGDTIWNRNTDSLINPINPFTSIKQKPKGYLTLSKGYYDENFTNDTLRQIGSVVFNTVTDKIDHFIQKDEQIERPKDNSRFMSIDPMAKKFPQLSPYQYAGNTPVQAVDIDGLEPASVVKKDGSLTQPAITLLSLVSYATADRIKQAKIDESSWYNGYIPWYSRYEPINGGAITIGNSITFTQNFFDNANNYGNASYGNDVNAWLSLLSHEVGHLPQEDLLNDDMTAYVTCFAAQYAINGSHDVPLEHMADIGRLEYNSFVSDVGIENVTKIFTNTKLSDNEKSYQIISLYQQHLDMRINSLAEQVKQLNPNRPADAKRINGLNKSISNIKQYKQKLENQKSNYKSRASF